jgi:hypothetical protein
MLPRLIFSIQGMLLKQKLGNEEATITWILNQSC